MDRAESLESGQCGLTDESVPGDWRLPTKQEWEAFMSSEYEDPALENTIGDSQWSEGDAFTGVQSHDYWSSTEYDSDDAWHAWMHDGSMYHYDKNSFLRFWAVRSVPGATLNTCGGTSVLANEPGNTCGPCGLDEYECDGTESTTCNGDTPCPNVPPNVFAYIEPSVAFSDDNLICQSIINDPDGPDLIITYEWYIGDTMISNLQVLDHAYTSEDDEVSCVVSASDGMDEVVNVSMPIIIQ